MKPTDSGTIAGHRYFSVTSSAACVWLLAIGAIVATYLVGSSAMDGTSKSGALSAIVAAFLTLGLISLFAARRLDRQNGPQTDRNVEQCLDALAAAGEFFAGALDREDTFRLIAHRIKEIVKCRSVALYTLDPGRSELELCGAEGPDADHLRSREAPPPPAATAFESGYVERSAATTTSRPAIAVPLLRDDSPFGALFLEFDLSVDIVALDLELLEAVASRVAPLVLGSISYERSQANALIDTVTSIPNERAVRLVLENQIAESARRGAARPLTVLALDVRSFDDVNVCFGHAGGDRLLASVAKLLGENLRQMDILARTSADEFVAVLPTASKEISHEIITRIRTAFFGRKFRVTDIASLEIELNIGWASFGIDGETADALLASARERKLQAKSTAGNLVFFPEEATV